MTPSMPRLFTNTLLFGALLLGILTSTDARLLGQSNGSPERFRAFAVDMTDPAFTRSGFVDIVINRWPTRTEQTKILGALDEGQDAFVKALGRNRRIGYIQTPDSIG